ncbi:MAG: class I SAM-dependent methyltransferase [Bacteroidetes bacterium]|nr:class I SAM-dependent methyltransferase [Bacteroidota bacterium]
MAITSNCARFLFYARKHGASFENALMLGRMLLYATKEDLKAHAGVNDISTKAIDELVFKDEYSEPLFKLLGAKEVNSLDFSDYEGASIIHDLNKPIPEALHNKFSVVFDGGTIEHVFNFPVCIENCMKLLKPGGHFIGITPCNNLMGHGFYQYSPELFYRVFSEENGFRVKKMFVAANTPEGTIEDWYEVSDPKAIKERVVLVNNTPTYILVLAEKTGSFGAFKEMPHQSDYVSTWINSGSEQVQGTSTESKAKQNYRKLLPKRLRIFLRNVYDLFYKEKIVTRDLGNIDAKHFRKFDEK